MVEISNMGGANNSFFPLPSIPCVVVIVVVVFVFVVVVVVVGGGGGGDVIGVVGGVMIIDIYIYSPTYLSP